MLSRWFIPGAFLLVYAYAFPYFGAMKSANELPRILLTAEIVDRGTFRIDGRLDELGSRFDVATTPDGHHYSNKAPGLSFMAIPGYLALRGVHRLIGDEPSMRETTWVLRMTTVTLPSVLFLPFFLALARRFSPRQPGQRAALAAYGLGCMAMPYALLLFSHQVAAVFAGASFIAAVTLTRGDARHPDLCALGCGAFAGLSVLVDYQSALAGLAVGLFLLVRTRRRVRHAALALLGAAPSAGLLAWYHTVCFGSPWRTGYSFAADPAHTQGVLGIVGPNRDAMYNALLAPDNGLITLAPWVLLAALGGVAITRNADARRSVGAEATVCGAIVLAYLLFLGSLVPEFGRAGWSVGPRYITVAMPFCAWLAAAGLARVDANRFARCGAQALVWVGILVFSLATVTYPHWPTAFANPLHEVSLRAVREGLATHSLGTLTGLPGAWAYAPFGVGVVALAGWLMAGRDRARWLVAAVALAAAVLVLVLYRSLAHTGPAQERAWRFIESTWEPRQSRSAAPPPSDRGARDEQPADGR